jgi:hypothetical protein
MEIKLLDKVRFVDTNGQTEIGTVECLPTHEFSGGYYNVSVAKYQGLVVVDPSAVVAVQQHIKDVGVRWVKR